MKEVSRPDEDINWELFSTAQEIAWKTGTSFGFRDAWAVGLNSKYVVGVWVGNADGEGRPGLVGRTAAAPLLFDVFSSLPQAAWFYQPFDEMKKVDICNQTGYRAGEACENTSEKWIPKTTLNTPSCPYHSYIYLDQTENYRVNANCYNMANAIKKSWFNLPPISAYFYKNHDPNYKTLPAFYPGCSNGLKENKLAIIYPKNNSQILIPYNFNEKLEKVVFEATHAELNAILHWHLDDQYLGTTSRIHQMELTPSAGIHTLSIIDETGSKKMIKFEILLSQNNH
jgi:penicillin-binding protein 1C